MKRWYVIHTRPREERIACTHLARQGFTVFLPEYRRRRSHARRVDHIRSPLFPRYLFVQLDLENTRWRAIASTVGVSHIVCRGDLPAPVPVGVVEDIQARAGADGFVAIQPAKQFHPGEAVQVIDGAFADQIGFYDCMSDEDRVILLLNLLGRQLRVSLPLASLAPVA